MNVEKMSIENYCILVLNAQFFNLFKVDAQAQTSQLMQQYIQ